MKGDIQSSHNLQKGPLTLINQYQKSSGIIDCVHQFPAASSCTMSLTKTTTSNRNRLSQTLQSVDRHERVNPLVRLGSSTSKSDATSVTVASSTANANVDYATTPSKDTMNEVSIHKVSNIKVVNTHRTRRDVNAGWSATNEILDGKCFLKQDSSMNIFRAEAKRRKEGMSEKVLLSPPPMEWEHVYLTMDQPISNRKGHSSKSRKSSKEKKDRRSIERSAPVLESSPECPESARQKKERRYSNVSLPSVLPVVEKTQKATICLLESLPKSTKKKKSTTRRRASTGNVVTSVDDVNPDSEEPRHHSVSTLSFEDDTICNTASNDSSTDAALTNTVMHDVDRKDSLQHLIKDLEAALYIAKNALAVKSKEDEEYMENLRRHGREALLRSPCLALIQDSMNDSNTEPKRRSSSLPRESSVQAAPVIEATLVTDPKQVNKKSFRTILGAMRPGARMRFEAMNNNASHTPIGSA